MIRLLLLFVLLASPLDCLSKIEDKKKTEEQVKDFLDGISKKDTTLNAEGAKQATGVLLKAKALKQAGASDKQIEKLLVSGVSEVSKTTGIAETVIVAKVIQQLATEEPSTVVSEEKAYRSLK